MAGDDEEMGDLIATLALEGAPTAFLPIDVQSRFGLGTVGAISGYNGFDINGLFGATGSMAKDVYGGLREAFKGEGMKAAERMAPSVFKRSINMIRGEGNIHDMKGEKLLEPTALETIAYLTGFQPKDLARMRQQKRLLQKSDQFKSESRRQDTSLIADILIAGDDSTAKQRIQELADRSPSEEFDDIATQVTRLAVQKILPADPTAGGTKANTEERREILESYGGPSNIVGIQEKGNLRRGFKTRLTGRPSIPSARQQMIEMLADNIRNINPSRTPQEALVLAQQQLGL